MILEDICLLLVLLGGCFFWSLLITDFIERIIWRFKNDIRRNNKKTKTRDREIRKK